MGKYGNNNGFGFGPDHRYVRFEGKYYAFDFTKMIEVCGKASKDPQSDEIEITNVYERDDEGDFDVNQKVEREMKRSTNSQTEMMCYDIVKLMMMSLISDEFPEEAFSWTLGTTLSFNTLLNLGILFEIDTNNQKKK